MVKVAVIAIIVLGTAAAVVGFVWHALGDISDASRWGR